MLNNDNKVSCLQHEWSTVLMNDRLMISVFGLQYPHNKDGGSKSSLDIDQAELFWKVCVVCMGLFHVICD